MPHILGYRIWFGLLCRRLVFSLFSMVCLASEALALTDEEIFEAFQFNFSLPGARSAALGRTFVGLADDATASISNPAGLTTLLFPEVSLEIKLTDHNIRRRLGAEDPEQDGKTKVFGDSIPQLSFLSLVYNYKGLTFGVYRYETFNLNEKFSLPKRSLRCCPELEPLPEVDATINVAISNWGGTAAVRLPKNFSVGLAFTGAQLDMEARTTRISGTLPRNILSQSIVNDANWSISSTLGFLYRPSEVFSAGLFYGLNPKFEISEQVIGLKPDVFQVPLVIKVPDRMGFGLALRPDDSWTIVADLLRIRYSAQTGQNFKTLLRFPELDTKDFAIDDQWEIHGGLEYVFLTDSFNPISVRGGFFTNPPHPLRYLGQTETLQGKMAHEIFGQPSQQTNLAFTGGVGAVFANYLQVDLAYLRSTLFNEATVSVIFHFGT